MFAQDRQRSAARTAKCKAHAVATAVTYTDSRNYQLSQSTILLLAILYTILNRISLKT